MYASNKIGFCDFENRAHFQIKSEIDFFFDRIRLKNLAIRHVRSITNQSELRHIYVNVSFEIGQYLHFLFFHIISLPVIKYLVILNNYLCIFLFTK